MNQHRMLTPFERAASDLTQLQIRNTGGVIIGADHDPTQSPFHLAKSRLYGADDKGSTFDADSHVRLGERVEKDMIAARIGPDWRLVAIGSPAYFATRPIPKHPEDLVEHDCINMRQPTAGGLYAWEFGKDGQELRVKVNGQLTVNDSYAMVEPALSGYGIAYVPESIVANHIKSGRLTQVLDEWSPFFDGYFIYYPSRRQNSAAFKVVLDALRYRE